MIVPLPWRLSPCNPRVSRSMPWQARRQGTCTGSPHDAANSDRPHRTTPIRPLVDIEEQHADDVSAQNSDNVENSRGDGQRNQCTQQTVISEGPEVVIALQAQDHARKKPRQRYDRQGPDPDEYDLVENPCQSERRDECTGDGFGEKHEAHARDSHGVERGAPYGCAEPAQCYGSSIFP